MKRIEAGFEITPLIPDRPDGPAEIKHGSVSDERGQFRVIWQAVSAAHHLSGRPLDGLHPFWLESWVQENEVVNWAAGTVRGLHWQDQPYAQAKLVRSDAMIFDVMVEIGTWRVLTATVEPGHWLYIPAGWAHGYQTLEKHATVTYKVSKPWNRDLERGVLFDSPGLGIVWPRRVTQISEKDLSWPALTGEGPTATLGQAA